jgi:arginase
VAQRLEAQAGRFWLHFDADVFDEGEMPAVTYPQPDGLSWDQLGDLLRPIASSPALVGVSVADYVPDKDSDGHHARRLVDLVGGLLTQRKGNVG